MHPWYLNWSEDPWPSELHQDRLPLSAFQSLLMLLQSVLAVLAICTIAMIGQFLHTTSRNRKTNCKVSMKANIFFFLFLRSSDITFTTGVVPLRSDMWTNFTLSRIVTWPTVTLKFQMNFMAMHYTVSFNRITMCFPRAISRVSVLFSMYVSTVMKHFQHLLNRLLYTMKLLRDCSMCQCWYKMNIWLLI